MGTEGNPEATARLRTSLGLDRPLVVQYVDWPAHAVLDVMREDYVRTARAKGVPEGLVVVKHTLRNALIPIVTVAGLQVGQLLAGSIILESVFVLPGLGRLALGAITARDLPVVQGVTLFVASSIVAINFLVDLAYSALDPRLRHE